MAFVDFKRKFRQASREYRRQWSLICLIAGAALLFLTFVGVFDIKAMDVSLFKAFNDGVGNWIYWLFILAIILFIVGAGYYYGYASRLKEFNELMETDSKAQFVRNQTRVEYLGWRLGHRFEDLVADKKASFRIK